MTWLLLLFALAQPVDAPDAASPPEPLGMADVRWAKGPSAEQLARVYPIAMQRRERPGEGAALCRIMADGRLEGCVADIETPKHSGFADATLQLTPYFQARPQTKAGEPTAGRQVRVVVRYNLPR
jgi:hypothetical protein